MGWAMGNKTRAEETVLLGRCLEISVTLLNFVSPMGKGSREARPLE